MTLVGNASQPESDRAPALIRDPLMAALAQALDGLDWSYEYNPTALEIVIARPNIDPEAPAWQVTWWATPGGLHAFVPITDPVAAAEQEAQMAVMAEVVPIPLRFAYIGFYSAPNEFDTTGASEIGLYVRLPMPVEFSPTLFGAGMILIESIVTGFEKALATS